MLAHSRPILEFTKEENDTGYSYLRSIGCNDGRFVCLLVRDEEYLNRRFQGRDWAYQDYRNSSIDDYLTAGLALADRGYHVIRMGKNVKSAMKSVNARIVDYANSSANSEFLDIWLMANCLFTISTGTGTDAVSNVFGKPVVYVNFLPAMDYVSFFHGITVFKKLRWKKSGELLSLEEMLANSYLSSSEYESHGISVVDLDPEEILDAVIEMEERISGRWFSTDLDSELDLTYREIMKLSPKYDMSHNFIHPESRLGAMFLRKNYQWYLPLTKNLMTDTTMR